jgi:hypothetical protein
MEGPKVLNSWKEIAGYVGRGVRTVQRWEREFAFPVRRPNGKSRSAVFAISSNVDEWLNTRPLREATRGSSVSNASLRRELETKLKTLYKTATELQSRTAVLQTRLAAVQQNVRGNGSAKPQHARPHSLIA